MNSIYDENDINEQIAEANYYTLRDAIEEVKKGQLSEIYNKEQMNWLFAWAIYDSFDGELSGIMNALQRICDIKVEEFKKKEIDKSIKSVVESQKFAFGEINKALGL